MVIKSFKLFERGDGIEDEDDIPTYRQMELDLDGNYTLKKQPEIAMDYILGVPSGEVVLIDNINDFKSVIDRKLAHYTYSFRGTILNCYCAPDNNLKVIRTFVNDLQMSKTGQEKYDMICKDYRSEMSRVTKRKHVVAYIPKLNGVDYYYIILPDLTMNKAFYKAKITDMVGVTKIMKMKHPDSVFSFTERLTKPGVEVKYYGLPKAYVD